MYKDGGVYCSVCCKSFKEVRYCPCCGRLARAVRRRNMASRPVKRII